MADNIEEKKTKAIPDNVSPRKKKKLEKIEAHLAKKREREKKTVILDNFGKKIIATFVCLAFVAILVPFGAITLSRKNGVEGVKVKSAIEYVEDAFTKATPKSITYEYKDGLDTNKEEFVFKGKTLASRVSYQGEETKLVMRMPTFADKTYIQTTFPAYTTDESVKEYVANNETDYLIITMKKEDGKYVEESYSLASTNYTTFFALGSNYEEIIEGISGITTYDTTSITKAEAKTKYNLFGLGYSYEDYKVFSGDSYVLFDGRAVKEVLNFTTDTKYTLTVVF